MKSKLSIPLALLGASALTASAVTVTVLPGDLTWGSTGNSGGGSSAITGTAPRSGNGSLELFGDRTRFIGLGDPYSSTSNLGLLSSLTNFTFDWMVAVGSAGTGLGAAASYSPALRLHIWDGTQRSELIWENAYNGNTSAVQGSWYSTGFGDNYYRYQAAAPVGASSGETAGLGIMDWFAPILPSLGTGYSANAYISAVSIGVGSSAGAGYHAFADNLTLSFGANNTTTYNFEATGGSVPDGGTTLVLLGGALTGLGALRRKFRK